MPVPMALWFIERFAPDLNPALQNKSEPTALQPGKTMINFKDSRGVDSMDIVTINLIRFTKGLCADGSASGQAMINFKDGRGVASMGHCNHYFDPLYKKDYVPTALHPVKL